MEKTNMNAVATLKKGEGRTLKAGGMWVYDNEIAAIDGTFENGDIVDIHDFDGFPMGRGFINEASKIRIRLLSPSSLKTSARVLKLSSSGICSM